MTPAVRLCQDHCLLEVDQFLRVLVPLRGIRLLDVAVGPAVVLAQPHRRGDKSQNCESPLGRLVAKRKLRHEVFDAGLHYGHKVWLWQAIRGVPVEIHASSGKSTGEGPKDATVRRWNVEITRIDRAMKQYPSPALTRCA